MNINRRCPFCGIGIKRHSGVLFDGESSACATTKGKYDRTKNEARRSEAWKKVWAAWGEVFGGKP